jgi:hypothetical protein
VIRGVDTTTAVTNNVTIGAVCFVLGLATLFIGDLVAAGWDQGPWRVAGWLERWRT